jgi:hypothetical protein
MVSSSLSEPLAGPAASTNPPASSEGSSAGSAPWNRANARRRRHYARMRAPARVVAASLLLATTVAAAALPSRYNHTYCKTTSGKNRFAHVDDGTLEACAAKCEQLKCPCFDYSTVVWALGKCRVVGSGAAFTLASSCSGDDCETSFVPGGYHGTVPKPDAPTPPPPQKPTLPPAPPPGECVWDSAKGAGAPDAKTACKAMGPDISVTSTLTGTHAAAPNVTHVDIQTVLYRTEPELVDAKKSRISVAAIPAGGCNGCDFFANNSCAEQFGLIELAGQHGADVAVLPEEFLWNASTPPPADCDMSPNQNCSIINALGAIAKKHSMYIVFGMRAVQTADDPYEGDPARSKGRRLGYNTDVILGAEHAFLEPF